MYGFPCNACSRFLASGIGLGLSGYWKEVCEVDGHIFRGIFKAERDFRFAQAWLAGKSVHARTSFAQDFFDVVAQLAANALQIARNAGFMLAKAAADSR